MAELVTPASGSLRKLPPETWGERLRRARLTTAEGSRLTHIRAAAWISGVTKRPIDHTTIGRLEKLTGLPTDRGQRRNAYLLTVLYSLDPAELGLGPDDGPGTEAVEDLRRVHSSTKWYGHIPCLKAG
jgi:hypothetical protein